MRVDTLVKNGEQADIVEFDSDLIVTAAPGSGKTKTVIDKVEKLASEKDRDKLIVAITYTYRAADEIAERLENRNISNEYVWTGTIHRFCLNFILNDYSRLSPKYSKGYEIADEDDMTYIRNKCAEEIGVSIDTNNPPNFSINPDGSYSEGLPEYKRLVKRCYEYLEENKLINFDLMLYDSYVFLKKYLFIQNNISHGIEWIIVDEYQDTKELQYQIIALIVNSNPNIKVMFVGDINQAIYTSLGGVVKHKDELDNIFNRVFTPKRLSGCFRSHQKIIDFYNNFACIPESIVSKTNEYENPVIKYYKNVSIDLFANFAMNLISKIHKNGIDYDEICVMLPQNWMLMKVSSDFSRIAPNIPIDAPTITPLKKIEDSVWNYLARLIFTDINYKNIKRCERFVKSILSEFSHRFNIPWDIDMVINILDYLITKEFNYSKTGTEELEIKMQYILGKIVGLPSSFYASSVTELLNATIRKIDRNKKNIQNTIECFLSCYKEKNGVVFSTCHGCKGEEYRAVIVGGLNEGYIPHKTRLSDRDESKHLLYVVSSRAKEILFLSSIEPYYDGRFMPNKELISLFIK